MENQMIETEPATITPGLTAGTLIPGFKGESRRPDKPILFIGGPLDGQIIGVPPDGRHYNHHTAPYDPMHDVEYLYVPAIIQLRGRATVVYLLEQRILIADKNAIEQEAIEKARMIEQPAKRIAAELKKIPQS